MANPSVNRIKFIDLARSCAVILALFSHSMITFKGFQQPNEFISILRFFTRAATPMFVLLFGMMLEIVYVRKAKEISTRSITRILLIRSLQCYLAYSITVFSSIIGGHRTLFYGLKTLLFFGNSHFGNILVFYTITLILALPIIILRNRIGIRFIIILLLVILLGFPILNTFKFSSFGVFNHIIGKLFGIGPQKTGPSIWHGMVFMLIGMIIASPLKFENVDKLNLRKFYGICSIILFLCICTVSVLSFENNLRSVLINYKGYTYRLDNHIGYYAMGILCSVTAMIILARIIPQYKKMPQIISFVTVLGMSSLFSYTLGNVLLNILSNPLIPSATILSVFYSLIFVIVNLMIVKYRHYIPFYSWFASILSFNKIKRID